MTFSPNASTHLPWSHNQGLWPKEEVDGCAQTSHPAAPEARRPEGRLLERLLRIIRVSVSYGAERAYIHRSVLHILVRVMITC